MATCYHNWTNKYWNSIITYYMVIKSNIATHNIWLDFGKLTELSHLAYSIILAELIATLVHYTYTVQLPGLVDWSAFLEQVLLTL